MLFIHVTNMVISIWQPSDVSTKCVFLDSLPSGRGWYPESHRPRDWSVAQSQLLDTREMCIPWPVGNLPEIALVCRRLIWCLSGSQTVKRATKTRNKYCSPSRKKLHLLKSVGFSAFTLKADLLHFQFALHLFKFHYHSEVSKLVTDCSSILTDFT